MKVSRDGLICRGGSETRRYGSIAGHVEILGLGSEGAKSEAAARLLAEVSRGCGAFEWVTFGYLGWMFALLAIFHRNIPHAMSYFAVHCAIASGILWLAWVAARSGIRLCNSRGIGIRWRFTFSFLRSCGDWCMRFFRGGLTVG